jgi:hypothetical protein
VLKTRIDQDALHQTSGSKLEQVRETKKECEHTREALPKYLQGHLFKFQARRVERHLKACPVCNSELNSLQYAADTKQLLKDITPSEGMAARMEAAFLFFGRLRILLYRPLWLLLLALIGGCLYFFVILPSRHDPELESIERSLPAAVVSAPATSQAALSPALAAAPTRVPTPAVNAHAPVPSVEPLAITITPDDRSSMRRINAVMTEHARLRKLRFSDAVREVSGSLTPGELQTLFSQIEQVARVSYSKKRLSALPTTEPIPFVMKLKDAPPANAKPAPAVTMENPAPAPTAAPPQPADSAPTPSAQP